MPVRKRAPLRQNATERHQPEKVAEFMLQQAEHPDVPIESIGRRVGLPVGVVRSLKQRIETRYKELQDAVAPIARSLLERRISERLDLVDVYLTPEKLTEKLDKASLAQIGVYEGIMLDKLAGIRGQPTQIISVQDQRKVDELAPALLQEIKRRGLVINLSERKAEVLAGAVEEGGINAGTGPAAE